MATFRPQQPRTDKLEPPKDTAGIDSYVASNTGPILLGRNICSIILQESYLWGVGYAGQTLSGLEFRQGHAGCGVQGGRGSWVLDCRKPEDGDRSNLLVFQGNS